MACGGNGNDTVLNQLKDIMNAVGDQSNCQPSCCSPQPCGPCCPPRYEGPFATVTMTCPPPILAPTAPQPVKPLQLPCQSPCCDNVDEEKAYQTRYSNFYNNYNEDYHNNDCGPNGNQNKSCSGHKKNGATIDGKNPCCEDYQKKQRDDVDLPGCPTGFKPCTMKLTPPPGCHPLGVWCAQIQPCPPKPKKKVSCFYVPEPCKRPCCKHWTPKEGPCLYDEPCKAHCFNHPPGIKPSDKNSKRF